MKIYIIQKRLRPLIVENCEGLLTLNREAIPLEWARHASGPGIRFENLPGEFTTNWDISIEEP